MANTDTTQSATGDNQAQGGQGAPAAGDTTHSTDQSTQDQATGDTTQSSEDDTQAQGGRDDSQDDQGGDNGDQEQDQDDSEDHQDDTDDVEDLDAEEQERLDEKVRRNLSKTRREAANLRTRLKGETARADKAEVALAAGLPQDAVKFLTGESREELEDNAADLLAMLGYQGRVTPPGNPSEVGVTPGGQDKGTPPDLDTIGARIYQSNH